MTPGINLIVLRCKDIKQSKKFYEMLGFTLQKEKHGNGPVHYSANINGLVLELYPSPTKTVLDNYRLGFSFSSLQDVIAKLDKSMSIQAIQKLNGREYLVIRDPDGRSIELVQENTNSIAA